MSKLTLILFLVVFNAFSESYVIESTKVLAKKELSSLKSLQSVITVKRFTQYKSEYFNRLYLIETKAPITQHLEKFSFIKLVEKNFLADFYEIKPNKNSKMVTNDLLFPLQWGLLNQEQIVSKKLLSGKVEETLGIAGYDIDWERKIKEIEKNLKRKPVVAVVDMGIDLEHPELKNQIDKNTIECDEDGKALGGTKVDKDKNSYPGDCHGWNFATTDDIYWQYPIDDKNHGTHIAGIIAGAKNNQLGISGVSDQIKILPVKVTGAIDESLEKRELKIKAPSDRIANGILYAIRRGVDVINLSLGWPKVMDTNFMRNTIKEAIAKNITVVAAAGNNNTNANIYPCSYYDVICVGSIDIDGNMSTFSNHGGTVDILAPGDQIVSTIPTSFIPLKLNVQGYDILSGTSQAAPFVSAAAALLKGTFANITNEEITRRLMDSAKNKKQSDKSLHGTLQLGKAFELKKAPSVKPIFKNFTEIIYDSESGVFEFPLNIKNFGTKANNINIHISSRNKGIKFSKSEYHLIDLGYSRPTSIIIKGKILDQTIDLNIPFKVAITTQNSEKRTYYHELSFAKNALSIKESQNIGFKTNGKVPIAFMKDGSIIDNLRTVDEIFPNGDFPSYFVKYQNMQKKDGIKVHLFNYQNGLYEQEENYFYHKNAVQLLSVTKGDFNYDQKDDLLIKTIINNEGDQHILYSYRNMDLTPLVGDFSDLKYYPRYVNIDVNNLRFNKTRLTNGDFLATPTFITEGALPKEDQSKDPWTKPDYSLKRRLYYLEVLEDDDGPSYQLRSQYNQDYISKLKSQFKDYLHSSLSINHAELNLLGFSTLNKKLYYQGQLDTYFSFGLGVYRENFIIDAANLTKKEAKLAIRSTSLLSSDLVATNSLTKEQSEDVFVRYLAQNKLSITILDENQTKYIFKLDDTNDLVQSFVSLFRSPTHDYAVLETVDHLVLASFNRADSTVTRSKVKTTKFSFLPGLMMSELFYPIKVLNSKQNLAPAIYVDSTRISGNSIYSNVVQNEKITKPVGLSVHVPPFCATKNPVPKANGSYHYTLLCAGPRGFYLKYLPLKL